jgi:predicted acyl esterase
VSTKEALRYDFNRFTFASRLVRKSSRLVLVLSAANSIQYERNYNSGGVIADESTENSRPVAVEIFHDSKRRSALYVPFAAAESPAAGR